MGGKRVFGRGSRKSVSKDLLPSPSVLKLLFGVEVFLNNNPVVSGFVMAPSRNNAEVRELQHFGHDDSVESFGLVVN